MVLVRKTDIIKAGLNALERAANWHDPELRRSDAEIAKAYAALAEALGDDGVAMDSKP